MAENKRPAIRFKGFIEEWEEHKLSNIATMKARIGWQGLTQKEFLNEGDYYLITGTDFENGQINFTNCHFISKDRYEQDTNIQVKNGDVLITKDGTIGKVAYIRGLEKPATLNAGVFVIKGNDKNVSNLYLYHYLAAPFLLDYANKQATGGTIKHLNQNVLVNFQIPLPKVKEQEKIGEFYQNIDNLIIFYKSKYDKLQKVKKFMIEKMFPQNGKNIPGIRFKEFKKVWIQRKLDEVAKYRNGKAHENDISEQGKYVVVNSKFVSTDGEVCKFTDRQIEALYKNEIAFVLSDVPNGKAIAKTFLVEKDDKYTLNQRIAAITPYENIYAYYLYILMNRNKYFLQFDDGAKQTNLSLNDVMNFQEFYPIEKEQRKIGAFFCNFDHLITLHQRKLEKLQTIKKSCLEKMFI